MLAMCVSSCNGDLSKSLKGTWWLYENDEYYNTYRFTSKTEGYYTQMLKYNQASFDVPFSYIYTPPKIAITMHFPSSDRVDEGEINGDIMNLGMMGSYVKQ